MDRDSVIMMAYAQLQGLQANIPDNVANMEFIELYHNIVNDLESLNVDLSRFRVPDSAVKRSGKSPWCSPSFLRAKVDGLLTLFQVSDDKQKIGFMPPTIQS